MSEVKEPLNRRELAAVLAGLRLVQDEVRRFGTAPGFVRGIMNDCESLTPLTPDEIDTLCERLNKSLSS